MPKNKIIDTNITSKKSSSILNLLAIKMNITAWIIYETTVITTAAKTPYFGIKYRFKQMLIIALTKETKAMFCDFFS